MPVVADIDDVLKDIRARIPDVVASAKPLNRVQLAAKTNHLAHLGFHVRREDTANTLNFRDRNVAGVEDSITITLTHNVKTPNQQASEAAAQAFARSIREALSDRTWVTPRAVSARIRYITEVEEVRGGWIVIIQNYSYRRQATL